MEVNKMQTKWKIVSKAECFNSLHKIHIFIRHLIILDLKSSKFQYPQGAVFKLRMLDTTYIQVRLRIK